MARLMDGEIEKIKKEVPLQDLVQSYGVKLEKKGKDLVGLCPLHDDHEPSLVISTDNNLWHCLGACQAGGSVIDWVMKIEGVSFRIAVEILKERYVRDTPGFSREIDDVKSKNDAGNDGSGGNGRDGKPVSIAVAVGKVTAKTVKPSPVRKLESPFENGGEQREQQGLLNQVVDFYNETLKDSPEGKDYLQKRGLENSEIIAHFKLGLSTRILCSRLPNKERKEGRTLRTHLQQLGILRETGHEHFAGSLVIPIFNEDGNVVEIYGRKLRNDLRKGTAYHLYLPGPHRGVWNVSCLAASKEIILCEALIDALTFWCYGFRNVTSSYGINGFTSHHLEAFKKYGTQRVFIAYDADEAGDKAAEALGRKLIAEGIECFRIRFPVSMDANQCAQRFKNVEKAFNQLIQNAIRANPSVIRKIVKDAGSRLPVAGGQDVAGVVAGGQLPVASENKETIDNSGNNDNIEHRAAKENKISDMENESPLSSLAAVTAPSLDTPGTDSIALRDELQVERKPEEVKFLLGDGKRLWRFRGLVKNMSYDTLKVNALVRKGDKYYLDTLDLCQARQRANFIKQAAAELAEKEEILKIDLGKMLFKLEQFQDEQIKKALQPDNKSKKVEMSEEERTRALELLKDPKLLDRILEDFRICGVVGEETNKLVGYLAAVSRKLDNPLAILIQSSSAAGKTWLMEAVLNFVPEEEKVKYSAMTGQSLFYMGESNLKHKILAIVEEEGAERTRYALKLLQSEGELSIASTGKDPVTGLLGTKEYRVQGPVMVFSTTTHIDIDEELQNRCIILTVDESREQTRAIHQMQRERRTLEGFRGRKEKEKLLQLHRNAQRLLRPLFIINPYSKRLTFLDDKTRTRRDHEKYLSLIDAIAFLHQYQRPLGKIPGGSGKKSDNDIEEEQHIVVTLEDIELANRLADDVLGRSLDELPPQTRRLLMLIEEMVDKECQKLDTVRSEYRFSRRQVREYCHWGNTQIKMHFKRLEDMEYLVVHRGKRGLNFEYELLYDGKGKDGSLFLMGLLDVGKPGKPGKPGKLQPGVSGSTPAAKEKKDKKDKNYAYDDKKSGVKAGWSGVKAKKSGSSRPQVGPKSGGCRVDEKPLENKVLPFFFEKHQEKGI